MAAKKRSAKAGTKKASPRGSGSKVAGPTATAPVSKKAKAESAAPVQAKRPAKKAAKAAVAGPAAVKAPAVARKPSVVAAKSPAAKSPAAKAPARKKATAARRPATAALRAAQKAPAKAPAAELTSTVRAGDSAPSFELPDQQGQVLSSESLAGQPYVLYFYPKDDTPGCTTEACGFRDAYPELESTGLRVIGVSPDSVASHQKFVGKYGLPFSLLSDASRELATAYGVWALKKNYGREFMGIVRSTFLVDGDGVVRKAWRGVRVNGHVAEVQAAAAELG